VSNYYLKHFSIQLTLATVPCAQIVPELRSNCRQCEILKFYYLLLRSSCYGLTGTLCWKIPALCLGALYIVTREAEDHLSSLILVSLSWANVFHTVKPVSREWCLLQWLIFFLQFPAEASRHEGWEYDDEGECVGGRQEHYRVPAVQETFLYGKKKGVCTGSGCVGVWSVMEEGTH